MNLWLNFRGQTDPFSDSSGKDFLQDSDAILILGQMISCAVTQLTCQLRTLSFSVLICGERARLIRWDRARAIVTERINYLDLSRPLAEVFHRFDGLTPAQRGLDTTVTQPSESNRAAAASMLRPEQHESESNEHSQCDSQKFKSETLVEYLVGHGSTDTESRFIRPPPKRQLMSLQGRSSRGCPVFDVKNNRICYLKDSWRVATPLVKQEGLTYEKLAHHGIPNIPGLVVHGDVHDKSLLRSDHSRSADLSVPEAFHATSCQCRSPPPSVSFGGVPDSENATSSKLGSTSGTPNDFLLSSALSTSDQVLFRTLNQSKCTSSHMGEPGRSIDNAHAT